MDISPRLFFYFRKESIYFSYILYYNLVLSLNHTIENIFDHKTLTNLDYDYNLKQELRQIFIYY